MTGIIFILGMIVGAMIGFFGFALGLVAAKGKEEQK
jgi:ABC-type microcin C transport system permease subunit YejE